MLSRLSVSYLKILKWKQRHQVVPLKDGSVVSLMCPEGRHPLPLLGLTLNYTDREVLGLRK